MQRAENPGPRPLREHTPQAAKSCLASSPGNWSQDVGAEMGREETEGTRAEWDEGRRPTDALSEAINSEV